MLRSKLVPVLARMARLASVQGPSAVGAQSQRWISSSSAKGGRRRDEVVVPGMRTEYGSLGEAPLPKPAAPWQAEHNIDVQRVTQKAIIYELTQKQTRTIESVVPWFLENMPPPYFRQVPERFRMDHIAAIAAVKDANMDLYLNLKSHLEDGRQVLTFIRPGTQPGTLLNMVEELPWHTSTSDMPLSRLHVFSSQDGSMSLNMFIYGLSKRAESIDVEAKFSTLLDYAEKIQTGVIEDGLLQRNPIFERDQMIEYIRKCSDNYLNFFQNDPRRFLRQRELFEDVSGTEGTSVHIDEVEGPDFGQYWVDVAVANSVPQVALEQMCRLLFLHDFDVTRARLDILPDGDNGSITLLRMLVAPCPDSEVEGDTFEVLARELKRSKWLDPTTTDLVFERYPWLGVTRGEIITAFCHLMHPVLAKDNAVVYSLSNITENVTNPRFIQHSASIADLFLDRFNPDAPLGRAEFESRADAIREAIRSDVEDTTALQLLEKMIDVVSHTLKTNVYLRDRYALGLRLDPRVMVAPGEEDKELPYGILFVHGRRFNAYHVRFRDISRGGMRLVTPKTPEQYALESGRQYDECYGLAFAQQLKNKDIPEGGSKAVNLINTIGLSENAKFFVMRKCVKAFTDSVLDLIVDTDETNEKIVDLFGKKEVLYLGPDEQVIPEDINWVIRRAGARGYGTPAAFMSSKPRAGINHKEFGVTSEGVNVYLDVALRHVLGIDPTKDSFTVKMTGGPDGDVGGNEINILFREYGDNVKIVGLADASGCAEDPEGLDRSELIRLVEAGLSITNFDESKLGENGVLHNAETPEGQKARNTMHNRVDADAFVPCGGRPNTIDVSNYKQFIKSDGTPSSKLVVEGANLFITSEARQKLFEEAGVAIVKDSSANKGGVITSSYEICAAMLLSEEEFFENKEQIVGEVLEKLRGLAKMEAELLFRESENFGGSLPEVSQVISNCINVTTDVLAEAVDTLTEEDRETLMPLFRAHLPKTLADLSFDAVEDKVPPAYVKNAISSCLASKLVYKEGTKFILAQPREKLAKIALDYMRKEKEIASLMEVLEQSELPEEQRTRIMELLEKGGARTALGVF